MPLVAITPPPPPLLLLPQRQIKSTLSGLPDVAPPVIKPPSVRQPRDHLVLKDWRLFYVGGPVPKFAGFDDGPVKDKAETSIAQKFHDNGGFRRAIALLEAPPLCFRPCAVDASGKLEEGTLRSVIRELLAPLCLQPSAVGVVMHDLGVGDAAAISKHHAYAVTTKLWGAGGAGPRDSEA